MAELDLAVRTLLNEGQTDEACTRVLTVLGPEIGGYLAHIAIDGEEAADVFSVFAEDVWSGLGGFRFEASLRTWCYVVARRALARHRRSAARRRGHQVPLSALGPASRIAAEIREQTATWKKTFVKDRIRALREQLDDDDQELLLLRVDRQLPFLEIAEVLADAPLDDATRRKQAAALRKRFERLKSRIRVLAEGEGLL